MIEKLIREVESLTYEGGWIFWCLVVLGFGIAFSLLSIWHFLGEAKRGLAGLSGTPEGGIAEGRDEVEGGMRELEEKLFAAVRRRIPFAFVLIGAAPLVGLLGTVSGMFTTFDGMASAVAVAPVDIIAKGVSEALITTQTGLVISVPTFIICSFLHGRYRDLHNGFQRLEAAALQNHQPAETG